MTAYSFKAQFRAPILAGTKRQAIRADRKRHARPGEELQLYTGMRTRQCAIIGRAVCLDVRPVQINVEMQMWDDGEFTYEGKVEMERLAQADGFASWDDMREFWRREHPGVLVFSGLVVRWGRLL